MEPPGAPASSLLEQAMGHHRAGRVQQAEALYRQILEQDPEQADALYLLGLVASQASRPDDAVALLERAIRARPGVGQYHLVLGRVLAAAGRHEAAVEAFREATRLQPDSPDAHNGLGIVLDACRAHEEAVDAFRRAIELRGDFAVAHYNLGNTLHELGRIDESIDAYRRAIAIEPRDPEMHTNLGQALMDRLDVDGALAAYDRALELAPDFAGARFNRALALLLDGRFEEGWREHEARHAAMQRRYLMPRPWRGEPLEGRSLFVHSEQGLGDAVQFVRFLPVLAAQGARITMRAQPQLLDLFRQSALGAEFVSEPGGEEDHDYQIPLLSIPGVLGTDAGSVPGAEGYLRAAPEKVAAYRERFFDRPGLKVGFVWQGNAAQKIDRLRSMPLDVLLPLLRVEAVEAYAMQKGERGERQLDGLPGDVRVTPLGPTFEDFTDTAAALSNLDLLISTCTSVPHVAGALGVPTWIMLAHQPDWRWLLERTDSPWYRSVRLFRQGAHGDWAPVVERVRDALAGLAAREG
jgi:tetratricopeptide (TPR) repeat protein